MKIKADKFLKVTYQNKKGCPSIKGERVLNSIQTKLFTHPILFVKTCTESNFGKAIIFTIMLRV